MIQLNLYEARALRDEGIARAVDSANRVEPGWADKAYEMFSDWLKGWPSGYVFLIEDFRAVARIRGLSDPPSKRAFGGLARKASGNNLIKKAGMKQVKNVNAHACYATQWQKI